MTRSSQTALLTRHKAFGDKEMLHVINKVPLSSCFLSSSACFDSSCLTLFTIVLVVFESS